MMNKTDRDFYALITEIGSLSEKELYHRMRTAYSSIGVHGVQTRLKRNVRFESK